MNRIILVVDSRIILKQYVISDSEAIFELIDSNRLYLSQHGDITAHKYPTIEHVRCSIANPKNPARLRFGIWDGNVFVGTINLTPNEDTKGNPIAEVGYFLAECHQGKGYIAKSLARLIQYAFFERNFQMIYADVKKENFRSANVLIRAGFQGEISRDDPCGFYLERKDFVGMR